MLAAAAAAAVASAAAVAMEPVSKTCFGVWSEATKSLHARAAAKLQTNACCQEVRCSFTPSLAAATVSWHLAPRVQKRVSLVGGSGGSPPFLVVDALRPHQDL